MKCPRCGSENTKRKGYRKLKTKGFTKLAQCLECNYQFSCGFVTEKEPEPQRKTVFRTEPKIQKKTIFKPKPIVKKLLSVDSVINIPCFCCVMQHNCNPIECEKLDNWLLRQNLVIEVFQ